MNDKIIELCLNEGWKVDSQTKTIYVRDESFPLCHPYQIHLKFYKESTDPGIKLHHMKAVHNYLWPQYIDSWNYWQESIFRVHCEGWKHISLASGAGAGKSFACGQVSVIYWLADPYTKPTDIHSGRGVIIASTTLDSLQKRIWGYVASLVENCALPIPAVNRGNPPKIKYPQIKSETCGIFAVAIPEGSDEKTINRAIGRHPPGGLMVILDESTDMAASILNAVPNWEQGTKEVQICALGNSKSRHDLHAAMSTPLDGWPSVTIDTPIWETTRENGICLYFNPYKSPAIIEPDPIKKAILRKVLITEEKIALAEATYGKNSALFWRFGLGFWADKTAEETLFSQEFLEEYHVQERTEWSGLFPLQMVAGFDPAFQEGGKGCVLRFAILGHSVNGNLVLDFRKEEYLHYLDIQVTEDRSGEIQIAERVIELLRKYNCPLRNLAIDATGAGRVLGELIRLKMGTNEIPIRIVSHRRVGKAEVMKGKEVELYTASSTDLWYAVRNFIQTEQIKGLDGKAIFQFTNRLLIDRDGQKVLEPKQSYTSRMVAINPAMGHSPDEGDCIALTLQAAIIRFGFFPGQKRQVITNKENSWMESYGYNLRAEPQPEIRRPPRASFSTPLENVIRPRRSD